MRSLVSCDVVAVPVTVHGIELGRVLELVLDLDAGRVLGLDVRCGDATHRFLPLAAARIGAGEITIPSALTLLDELDFYLARGSTLGALRGAVVTGPAGPLGTLRDVVFDADGAIRELVVVGADEQRVPPGADVRVTARTLAIG
jgi:sporulation protein YlmC with PRC-barrel domain